MSQKYIVHFSCGVPSAVAAWMALREFGHEAVRVCRQDTGSEHPDNERFMADFVRWSNHPIEVVKSKKYSDVDDVIERTGWIVGPNGARCTSELKKIPAQDLINWGRDQEIEILGYTLEEGDRVAKWIDNNRERKMDAILIRHRLSRADCMGIIDRAGITPPVMYSLGYKNNNCIGCVKGQAGYWNKIRVDFPEVFARRARQERQLNAAICKIERRGKVVNWPDWVKSCTNYEAQNKTGRIAIFLDELAPDYGIYEAEAEVQCGLFCMTAMESFA